MKKIYIGADHAGKNLLSEIKNYLLSLNYEVEEVVTNDDKDDYPDIAKTLANLVVKNNSKGIAVCGTGIGISIACNKVKKIRASICYDEFTTEMAVKHNNLNILCFGERTEVGKNIEKVKRLTDIYLNTVFEGGKHQKRIDLIDRIGE